jgi:hypothetical protein
LIVIPIWIALSFPGSKKDKHLPIFWAIQTIPEMLLAGVVFRQQLYGLQEMLNDFWVVAGGAGYLRTTMRGLAGRQADRINLASAPVGDRPHP